MRFLIYLILFFIGRWPVWKTVAFVFSAQFSLTVFAWFAILDCIAGLSALSGRPDQAVGTNFFEVAMCFLGCWMIAQLCFFASRMEFYPDLRY